MADLTDAMMADSWAASTVDRRAAQWAGRTAGTKVERSDARRAARKAAPMEPWLAARLAWPTAARKVAWTDKMLGAPKVVHLAGRLVVLSDASMVESLASSRAGLSAVQKVWT